MDIDRPLASQSHWILIKNRAIPVYFAKKPFLDDWCMLIEICI